MYNQEIAKLNALIEETKTKKAKAQKQASKLADYINKQNDKAVTTSSKKKIRILFVIMLILGVIGSSSALWLASYQDAFTVEYVIPIIEWVSIGILGVAVLLFFFCGFRFSKSFAEEEQISYTFSQKVCSFFLVRLERKVNKLSMQISLCQNQINLLEKENNK